MYVHSIHSVIFSVFFLKFTTPFQKGMNFFTCLNPIPDFCDIF